MSAPADADLPPSPSPWASTSTSTSTSASASTDSPLLRPAAPPRDALARALSYAGPSSSSSSSRPYSTLDVDAHAHAHAHAGAPPSAPAPAPQRPHSMLLAPSFRGSGHPLPARAASSLAPPTLSSMSHESLTWRARAQGDTPLERTIDAIGMGRYQWALLVLTGCGWAADNMWLQGIAIILPRVQADFGVGDVWIGLLSSSTFAGMMLGALGWGTYSDSHGRKDAFNGTLVLVAVFGSGASLAPGFPSLCALLFLLGLGLGGSMPTDGTLFLENLPARKQYLLTALSVFFAAGSVASSALGLLIIPRRGGAPAQWRWFLACLGALTGLFLVARLLFFRLLESPRFLVSSGRPQEARVALQRIAAYNGTPLPVALSDVRGDEHGGNDGGGDEDDDDDDDGDDDTTPTSPRPPKRTTRGGYSALATGPTEARASASASESRSDGSDGSDTATAPAAAPAWLPPSAWHDGFASLRQTYATLLRPPWRLTTLLVWGIWAGVTLAYTMFNVFLPKFLEERGRAAPPPQPQPSPPDGPSAPVPAPNPDTSAVLADYLLYSLASLPGSLLGAYLIELPLLGRRRTMSLSLLCTALSLVAFLRASSRTSTLTSSMGTSLAATTAYAAIYGYTPEVFPTGVRGTASGTASALSRLAGIAAPLIAGGLFESVGTSGPLGVSVGLFLGTVGMCVALPIETRGRAGAGGTAAGH